MNKEEILEVFKYLEENKIFAYIEELSLEVSNQYLKEKTIETQSSSFKK
ncbi:Response regulator aspartate phosphatase A [Bacillus licheniformis]|nr:Response regulator aspartate phosphatase A [Bacillus licheniformis]